MPIITVHHEVSDQFLLDVMTNAVESGAIDYWAAIHSVMRNAEFDITEFQVAEVEDLDEDAEWFVIDKDAVLNGITTIMTGSTEAHDPFEVDDDIKMMVARAVSENDADIDATGCDVIVQAAMFGEVVYS